MIAASAIDNSDTDEVRLSREIGQLREKYLTLRSEYWRIYGMLMDETSKRRAAEEAATRMRKLAGKSKREILILQEK